jgi:hypothetical protein
MSDSVATTTTPITTGAALIDEESHRLPNFLGGEPIVLADGQEWQFPKPMLEFCPSWAGSAVTGVSQSSDQERTLRSNLLSG